MYTINGIKLFWINLFFVIRSTLVHNSYIGILHTMDLVRLKSAAFYTE